jgi:succinoglycan biosynthesis protein ExoV
VRLFYFQGANAVRNFGDELNPYMWPRLLPGAFDDNSDAQFVGIGTLLNDRLPAAPRTIVFGAGVGYYGPPRPDHTWTIYCVRGPLSARALGLPADAAVTDPAVLIARLAPPCRTAAPRWSCAFMPHWQSEPDVWQQLCAEIGIGFVDPRWAPEDVLDALQRTDVLITEAMHGAIVADALRIRWIPVRTRRRIHTAKWEDWCGSLSLDYRPHDLPTIWPASPRTGLLRRARRRAKLTICRRALAAIAKRARPILSRDNVLEARLQELDDRLEQLRTKEGAAALN